MKQELYPCPCCGYRTLPQEADGSHEICSICFWEDDRMQLDDPNYEGGANVVSLRQAQETSWNSALLKDDSCAMCGDQPTTM